MTIIDELRRRVVADLATAMKSPETPFTRGTIFAFELTLADIDSLVAAEAPEPSITDLMATLERSLASHRDNGHDCPVALDTIRDEEHTEVDCGLREGHVGPHRYPGSCWEPDDTDEDDKEAAMQARADAAMADRAFGAMGVEG